MAYDFIWLLSNRNRILFYEGLFLLHLTYNGIVFALPCLPLIWLLMGFEIVEWSNILICLIDISIFSLFSLFNVWCHLSDPSSEKYYWSYFWPMHTLLPCWHLWLVKTSWIVKSVKKSLYLLVYLNFPGAYYFQEQILFCQCSCCLSKLSTFEPLRPLSFINTLSASEVDTQ